MLPKARGSSPKSTCVYSTEPLPRSASVYLHMGLYLPLRVVIKSVKLSIEDSNTSQVNLKKFIYQSSAATETYCRPLTGSS